MVSCDFCQRTVTTTISDIGQFLEAQAKIGEPINYGQLIARFLDLPPLKEYWRSHPLCSIFGELDDEDHLKKRPFRTALDSPRFVGKLGLQNRRPSPWA